MALIRCPECEKEVSDKAHDCPFCGFPLQEYFEERELKKKELEREELEKQRLERIAQRKIEYSEKKEFHICGEKILFDCNEKICAIICSEFQARKESMHKKIQNMLLSGKGVANLQPDQFEDYADQLTELVRKPLIDASLYLCTKFLNEAGEKRECLADDVNNAADFGIIYEKLMETIEEAYNEFDLNITNAHVEYYDDYYAAGTPAQPIDAVYADTLLGLAGKSISASLINGAAAALTAGKVKRKEKQAKNKYYETVNKEALAFNAKVYSVLDKGVDIFTKGYKGFVFDYLIKYGALYEKYEFPRHKFSFDTYKAELNDQETLNETKKPLFINGVKNNPGDFLICITAMGLISFTEDEFLELMKFIDCFRLGDDIKYYLQKMDHPAKILFDDNVDITMALKSACIAAREFNGRLFDSVEEKEAFIAEQKKRREEEKKRIEEEKKRIAEEERIKYEKLNYKTQLDEFFTYRYWNNFKEFKKKYKSIEKLGTPQYVEYKQIFEYAIEIGKLILDKIDRKLITSIAAGMNELCSANDIATEYVLKDIYKKREDDFNKYAGLKDAFLEDELPIIKIEYSSDTLLVSTNAFYAINTTIGKLENRFTLDDIMQIYLDFQSDNINGFLSVDLGKKKRYIIFDKVFPEKDWEYVKGFVKVIEEYINTNPIAVKWNLIKKMCVNTPKDYLSIQIRRVIKVCYLTSQTQFLHKEYIILKWAHEIIETNYEENGLKEFVENNIDKFEFVFWYDGYRVITDQAIYEISSEKKLNAKYIFEDVIEITPLKALDESCGKGFLIINKKEKRNSLIEEFLEIANKNTKTNNKHISLITKLNGSDECFQFIAAIIMLLQKEGVKTSVLMDLEKELVYCSACNNYIVDDFEHIEKCYYCSSEIKKTGWINDADYKIYAGALDSITNDTLRKFVTKTNLNFDAVFETYNDFSDEHFIFDQNGEVFLDDNCRILQNKEKNAQWFFYIKQQLLDNVWRFFPADPKYAKKFRENFLLLITGTKLEKYVVNEPIEHLSNASLDKTMAYMRRYCKDQILLYVNGTVLVTDHYIVWGNLVKAIDDIQEIMWFDLESNHDIAVVKIKTKYNNNIYSCNKENQDKLISLIINVSLEGIRDGDFSTEFDKDVCYCEKCGSRNVEIRGVFTSKCNNCGNRYTGSLYRNYWKDFSAIEKMKHKLVDRKNALAINNVNVVKSESNQEKMIYCSYCGKRILRKANFCNYCGKPNQYIER